MLTSDIQAEHARFADLMQAKGLGRSAVYSALRCWLRRVVLLCFLPFWKMVRWVKRLNLPRCEEI
ncbi:MAG: hypothetical protein CML60_06700 [Rhodobacteraceae bacterium]|nr:hypothetical protein [Paracoccaceae bacterium]